MPYTVGGVLGWGMGPKFQDGTQTREGTQNPRTLWAVTYGEVVSASKGYQVRSVPTKMGPVAWPALGVRRRVVVALSVRDHRPPTNPKSHIA